MTGSLPFCSAHVSRQDGNVAPNPYGLVDTRSIRRLASNSPWINDSFHAAWTVGVFDESSMCTPINRAPGVLAPAVPVPGRARTVAAAAATAASSETGFEVRTEVGSFDGGWCSRSPPTRAQPYPCCAERCQCVVM